MSDRQQRYASGCALLILAVVPATGACLLLIGVIYRFVIDSWLIAIGSGMLAAFPILVVTARWIRRVAKRGEAQIIDGRGGL